MGEKYLTIKNWNTDWKDHPYWEMTEEEQIEYEVYSDGVDIKELRCIKTKRRMNNLMSAETKLIRTTRTHNQYIKPFNSLFL